MSKLDIEKDVEILKKFIPSLKYQVFICSLHVSLSHRLTINPHSPTHRRVTVAKARRTTKLILHREMEMARLALVTALPLNIHLTRARAIRRRAIRLISVRAGHLAATIPEQKHLFA